MTTYARPAKGRVDHIVAGATTRCGLSLRGMATWPAKLAGHVDLRPTCEACRTAKKESA